MAKEEYFLVTMVLLELWSGTQATVCSNCVSRSFMIFPNLSAR